MKKLFRRLNLNFPGGQRCIQINGILRQGSLLIPLLLLVVSVTHGQVSREISYVNLSRPNGGSVSPGDTLEIRAVLSVRSGTNIYRVRYTGTIPINTTYIAGTLSAKTNEGQIGYTNTGNYTDASGDDRAQISGTNIVMNLGQTAGIPPANGGTINGGSTVPHSWGAATIIQATYRVRASSAIGTQIVITGNAFRYANTSGGTVVSYPTSDFGILVNAQFSCGALDATNMITDELSGTYASGTGQNRIASPIVTGFTYSTISNNTPNDGSYAVVKNSSPSQTTNIFAPSTNRAFSVWEIFGDHTGTNDAVGNPPSAAGANGGYMLIVNASYAPSSVFTTTVNGLAPFTTYTFSFWIRNLCGNCSSNPTGGGMTGNGVLPNLALSINGLDYYTTGNLPGLSGWVKKSFTFNSGSSTNFNINLRNNAPGGGGNDWAIDDFEMYQCLILLPVSLNDLTAYYNSGSTTVSWTTGNDEMVDKYIVEYSTDGKSFQKAGELTANNSGKYIFNDKREVNGKMYYRVMVLDKNARAQFSKVMIVRNNNFTTSESRISPNPAKSNPTISVNSDSRQTVKVRMIDYSGRAVTDVMKSVNKGSNSFVLNTSSNITSGVYVVQVIYANGKIESHKLVIDQR
ncbi:MAG: T9SS type A sorting domain-containing protein [Chitinophagaceae bacterium]